MQVLLVNVIAHHTTHLYENSANLASYSVSCSHWMVGEEYIWNVATCAWTRWAARGKQ